MHNNRKTDMKVSTQFRSDRFSTNGQEWFFATREGAMEGPFSFKLEAEERLEIYKRVMASGFMPQNSKLAIEPLHEPQSE